MPRVAVVIPWRGGCPHRDAALAWTRERWRWPVTLAEPPAGPWRKGAALAPAVAASDAEILVVADADVWCDRVDQAVDEVTAGAGWAIPHRIVHRLTMEGSAAVYAGAPWHEQPLDEDPYPGVEGGGILVARRETLLGCPLDPRFTGWGQEDESWAAALTTLHGPAWRGSAPLIHFFHPPQQRASRRRGSQDGWLLRRRYMKARRDPDLMLELLGEAHAALAAPQPHVHDHAPQRVG